MSALRGDSGNNWMIEEENDFEHGEGSCLTFCAGPRELLSKCLNMKKSSPPDKSDVDVGIIAEGVLDSNDFELQQVYIYSSHFLNCIYAYIY